MTSLPKPTLLALVLLFLLGGCASRPINPPLTQADLAERAGVSVGTVKALEKTGQTSVASLIRVAQALGLTDQLQSLFVLKVQSIADMEQAQLAQRERAPRKTRVPLRSRP